MWEIHSDRLGEAGVQTDQSLFCFSFTRTFLGDEVHVFIYLDMLWDDWM